jgi:hypothetical protein
LRQTKNADIPIRVYSKSQTGAKIQPGGVNEGFCKVAYQVGTFGAVNKEPIMPAL